jgi:glycosyltransferase involved in cell wall biosynthesis
MPKRFLISIIGLNRLDATRACIEAVFRHSKNFDLVLINNASTDGTGDYFDQLARDYPNVTVYCAADERVPVPGKAQGLGLFVMGFVRHGDDPKSPNIPDSRRPHVMWRT